MPLLAPWHSTIVRLLGSLTCTSRTASADRIVYRHRPNLEDDISRWPRHLDGTLSMEIVMRATSHWTDVPFLEAIFSFWHATQRRGARRRSIPSSSRTGRRGAAVRPRQVSRRRTQGAAQARSEERLRPRARRRDPGGGARAAWSGSGCSRCPRWQTAPRSSRADRAAERLPASRSSATPRGASSAASSGAARRAALTTAYLFAAMRPVFLELDLVTFRSPVSVGDLPRFESCVRTRRSRCTLGRLTIHVSPRERLGRRRAPPSRRTPSTHAWRRPARRRHRGCCASKRPQRARAAPRAAGHARGRIPHHDALQGRPRPAGRG